MASTASGVGCALLTSHALPSAVARSVDLERGAEEPLRAHVVTPVLLRHRGPAAALDGLEGELALAVEQVVRRADVSEAHEGGDGLAARVVADLLDQIRVTVDERGERDAERPAVRDRRERVDLVEPKGVECSPSMWPSQTSWRSSRWPIASSHSMSGCASETLPGTAEGAGLGAELNRAVLDPFLWDTVSGSTQ